MVKRSATKNLTDWGSVSNCDSDSNLEDESNYKVKLFFLRIF